MLKRALCESIVQRRMQVSEASGQEYRVLVDDNARYMDEDERYLAGSFTDCACAMARCRYIVDQFLWSEYKEGMEADELLGLYKSFGEDAWISSADDGCKFSAWEYAAERCAEICRAKE